MDCRIHDRPGGMVCSRCAEVMCPLCAEYIDGNWYCPDCAIEERRIAAGLDYRTLMAACTIRQGYEDESPDTGSTGL